MADVIIPPDIRPESPVEIELVDDLTRVFSPAFGRGLEQRQTDGDPRWSMKLRYRGLRAADRARLRSALTDVRGAYNTIRVCPAQTVRGSFPTSEIIVNNSFINGTTGWVSGSQIAISVSDQIMRSTRTAGTLSQILLSGGPYTGIPYAVYAMRAFVRQGRGNIDGSISVRLGSTSGGTEYKDGASGGYGLRTEYAVPSGTSLYFTVADTGSVGRIAGDYNDIIFTSLSRCALVDGGQNLALYSDTLTNGAWSKSGLTATDNVNTAPDGTITAANIIEDTSTGQHFITQSGITRPSVSEDLCAFGVFSRNALSRDIRVVIGSNSSNYASCIFDLSNGSPGSVSLTGSMTNGRAYSRNLGSGRYLCVLVAKAQATTNIFNEFDMVSGGSNSYTGTTGSIVAWRLGVARSSVPVSIANATTSTARTGDSQISSNIRLKGLPCSMTGLLLPGALVEINGELKMVTASLDSSSVGTGYLQFRPALFRAAADNDTVIVLNPMGRFIVPGGLKMSELYGTYTDMDLEMREVYE